jgi:uncharacterized protein DUF1905
MNSTDKLKFSAKIYLTGINWCVVVPTEITNALIIDKGRIHIKGKINEFSFIKTLMPVKNSSHRLFVNKEMMLGGKTALGEVAVFEIQQDYDKVVKQYPVPNLLSQYLTKNKLSIEFDNLTSSRKRAILKYLNYLKKEESLVQNIEKLIIQLKNKVKNVRIP